ncbi:hypothetical protein CAPTEDRAFT_105072 [Capitella teleta]|uniref:Phosphomevalonate kinase n=1 Tax=Capitella teleta TaxID=283909 RepID=R7T4P3_CAPTE|nr:hypothetical protein CAPTEDRAFT_105072 [Capitella teleta]|eukprot:ELT87821.1 hypothetical protein CAPTEDRAFT_105072 [Capitella teleta]
MAQCPVEILIFSGKRKSGKDYVTDIIKERLSGVCSVLRLSGPLKAQYAQDHNLDLSRLLDATEYKEKYRADMIAWGESKRSADPGYFCRIICTGPGSEKPIWIISDARRRTDVEYYQTEYPGQVKTVRVEADESVRRDRGWVFTSGVDDAESECDLDETNFDLVITNNGDSELLENALTDLIEDIRSKLAV